MRYSLYLLSLLLVISASRSSELDLTLPVYHLQIDSVYLEKLYLDPSSNEYFPAAFIYANISYECEIKFRGGTARYHPKKSWALKFNDNDNVFNAERINLNAEYQDRSLLRNHLAMKLFQYFDQPAPNNDYVNLFINDEYMGVFLQIEEVSEDFLKRNNRQANTLYEAQAHGASMAPLTHYDDYLKNWDKKIGAALNFTDIQMLFNRFYYWKKNDFEKNIEKEIDVDNFLTYFAIEFTIVAEDCFTKNFFFFFNGNKSQWEIFPWDNDVTFGNDIRGSYHPNYGQFCQQLLLNNQLLFQRLMEFEQWRNKFCDKLSQVTESGFDYLFLEIDSTYHIIKNDVYQDNNKLGNNSGFDYAVQQIKTFLAERKIFLDDFRYFERTSLSDYYCSNPFPSATNPHVVFRVRSQIPQPNFVHYIKNFPWKVWAGRYTVDSLQLFDDGNHDDLEADDLIYGNRLAFDISNSRLIPFCFKASHFDYPANGFFYIECYRTHTMALNINQNADSFNQHLRFGRVFKNNDSFLLELINSGSKYIDLSYCHLQAGTYFQNFLLPENTVLGSNDTLILTSNKALADHYFNHFQSVGNFSFEIKLGDTLKLLSPTLSELLGTVCDSFSMLNIDQASIIINEINYNSSDSLDVGDWVEFYNPRDFSVDLSGWYFKDEEDNHVFVFPQNSIINPQGYLVLCQNQSKFHCYFSSVSNYVGDFGFGLDGSGELIRIYDLAGNIIDSVCYDDKSPWSAKPDGDGPTLELRNPMLDNSLAQNWAASTNHGTPGERNSVFTGIAKNQSEPSQFHLYQNYPNPFNGKTTVRFDLAEPGSVELKIYNLKGQLVKTIKPQFGERVILCNMTGFSSGIYFYYLKLNNRKSEIKKAILLK